MEAVGLNFSSTPTPELILKTFEQYCEDRQTPNRFVLAPILVGRWLDVFRDEIDFYVAGNQEGIGTLLDMAQFVGACNPLTDRSRVPLSHRFLRHAPLVMVDYPGEVSLKQIYGTYNRAALKDVPNLRAYTKPLTGVIVAFYLAKGFTTYAVLELARWDQSVYEATLPLQD
ncbi:dynein heavy chain [Marasmius sp. AFHP31]|nr:dynein heavy chain [Marasmius sp. AFHP31]